MTWHWWCMGVPPLTPPCGAHGEGQKGAEDHVKTTGHATTGSIRDDWGKP